MSISDPLISSGPAPYTWYALVDPETLEHVDSFRGMESAVYINSGYYGGKMLVVGMCGETATKSLGRINPDRNIIKQPTR